MNRVRLAVREDASMRGFAVASIELLMPGARL
jgi:hypothetical protein